MKRIFFAFFCALACICGSSHGQVKLNDSSTVVCATVEQGKAILTTKDDFVLRMSLFDRAARIKTDQEVSEEEYLEFVGMNVLPWSDEEKRVIASALEGIPAKLEPFSLPLPEKVYLVKTTGSEEGGAAYTRGNAIIFPKANLTAPVPSLQQTICHELFHILSRCNPDLREKLYAVIGFVKCNEVDFPSELKPRKLTNPDAPKNDHCILVQAKGKKHWAVPILFSRTEKYDVKRGGEFFHYLEFRFLLVERDETTSMVKPMYDGQKAELVDMRQVSGFIEQVGRNTGYIIHPEEILADNFALLVLKRQNLPSPDITGKMEEILKADRKGEPKNAGDRTQQDR